MRTRGSLLITLFFLLVTSSAFAQFARKAPAAAPSAPAAGETGSEQGGPELTTDAAGNPVLKYPVGHQHAASGCGGWLYISKDRIKFESLTLPAHSFDLARADLTVAQQWHFLMSNMPEAEFKFRNGTTWHFFHLKRAAVEDPQRVAKLKWNDVLDFQPLIDGATRFDEVVGTLQAQQKPKLPPVMLSPAGPPTAEAAALLEKALRYRGGDKLRAVYSYRQRGTRTTTDEKGTNTYTMDSFVALPDRVHMEITDAKGGKTIIVLTPAAAFGIAPNGQRFDMPAYLATDLRAGLRHTIYLTARQQHDGGLVAALAGDEMVAGTPVAVVELRAGADRWRWWVDPATGRILRMGGEQLVENGATEFSADDLADYRAVDGMNIPFRFVDTRGTEVDVTDSIELNPVVDPSLFYDKPAALGEFHPAAAPPAPLVMQGTLRVTSQPAGAMVYVDDITKGATSQGEGLLIVEGLTPGARRVRVTASGYNEWTKDVDVRAGETATIEAKLARSGPPPLSVADVEEMLRGGVSSKRAAVLVKERGVDFLLDNTAEQRLRAAGADGDLLLAIAQNKR